MEAVAARSKSEYRKVLSVRPIVREKSLVYPKSRVIYRCLPVCTRMMPKPWEKSFDGMWCNEWVY